MAHQQPASDCSWFSVVTTSSLLGCLSTSGQCGDTGALMAGEKTSFLQLFRYIDQRQGDNIDVYIPQVRLCNILKHVKYCAVTVWLAECIDADGTVDLLGVSVE